MCQLELTAQSVYPHGIKRLTNVEWNNDGHFMVNIITMWKAVIILQKNVWSVTPARDPLPPFRETLDERPLGYQNRLRPYHWTFIVLWNQSDSVHSFVVSEHSRWFSHRWNICRLWSTMYNVVKFSVSWQSTRTLRTAQSVRTILTDEFTAYAFMTNANFCSGSEWDLNPESIIVQ